MTRKAIMSQSAFNQKKQLTKLVSGLAIFILLTSANKKIVILDFILYIYYLIPFQKDSNNVQTIINSSHKDNKMTATYI